MLEQCVAIRVTSGGGERRAILDGIKDAHSLSVWLHRRHAELCQGNTVVEPCAVLLTGAPAAGKTSLLSQVVMHSLELLLLL